MQARIQLKILDKRMHNLLPEYVTHGAAGLDLRICIEEKIVLYPGDTILAPAGIAVYIEDSRLCGIILPRSGLGHKHGIVLGNLVGLIDSDYQGELMISLWNRSNQAFELNPMERIAQLVIIPVMQVGFNIVNEFSATIRGSKGFGSTGKH
jgi:dUTP pyrophosphatase